MNRWNHKQILFLSIFIICAFITNCNASEEASSEDTDKKKVCIIGAGPSGLTSAKQLADNKNLFDIVVFEKNNDLGGVWLYTDKSDVDEHNLPVTCALYRDLRTNVPKSIMAYPDYQEFHGENRSCVGHRTVFQYLRNFTEQFHLDQYMRFNTLVQNVIPRPGKGNWRTATHEVVTKNLETNEVSTTICDAVMIANGHFSEPNIPKIPGFDQFKKKFKDSIIHSLSFRVPEAFAGKTAVVLGASASGIDIAIGIASYAKKVYLSHRHEKIQSPLPDNIEQIPGVVSAEGTTLILQNGKRIDDADAFIFCTGYKFTFPFLKEESGLTLTGKYVAPLYNHLVYAEYPSMSFIGMTQGITFPAFYMHAKYATAVLTGVVDLPDLEARRRDSQLNHGTNKASHNLGDAAWAWYDELAKAGKFEPLPKFYRNAYTSWMKFRDTDYVNFRDSNLIRHKDDTVTIVHPNNTITPGLSF